MMKSKQKKNDGEKSVTGSEYERFDVLFIDFFLVVFVVVLVNKYGNRDVVHVLCWRLYRLNIVVCCDKC